MKTYISNAFSLQMVAGNATIRTKKVNLPAIARRLINPVSVVGHADTARVFEALLGIPIAQNRQSITLTDKDTLYIGQISGGRLPEGATTLPKNFKITWLCVRLDAEPKPLERHWIKGDGSIYGSIDSAAENVAKMVGGEVSLMGDTWGNPHWEINAPGFSGHLWDD